MALLSNGLETIELGSTAWRIVLNNNIGSLYTKEEINNRNVATTHTEDITFTVATKGVVLKDRTTATNYRLFVNNGVLSIEAI